MMEGKVSLYEWCSESIVEMEELQLHMGETDYDVYCSVYSPDVVFRLFASTNEHLVFGISRKRSCNTHSLQTFLFVFGDGYASEGAR